jgi:hypothetical protein
MSLPIEAELAEFVDDSWLIREFTCFVRPFYRSSAEPINHKYRFFSSHVRWVDSQGKPKVFPKTPLPTPAYAFACRAKQFICGERGENS